MYDNAYNRKIADEIAEINDRYLEQEKRNVNYNDMTGKGMSGGFAFLAPLAGMLLPMILNKVVDKVTGGGLYDDDPADMHGSGMYDDELADMHGSGLSLGGKPHKKAKGKAKKSGKGTSGGNRNMAGWVHSGGIEGNGMDGSGILSGLLSTFGLGKPHKKRGKGVSGGEDTNPELGLGMDGSGILSGLLSNFGLGKPKRKRGKGVSGGSGFAGADRYGSHGSGIRDTGEDVLSEGVYGGARADLDQEPDSEGVYGSGGSGGSKRRPKSKAKQAVGKKLAKASPWISHLKKESKRLGISYRDAMQSPAVKASYRK